VAAASTLLSGCDSSPAARVAIAAHYVPACAPTVASAPTQLQLIALGDFDRSNDSVSILSSNASLQALGLPANTRGVELETLGDQGYWGTGTRDTHNQISVLLWPREEACELAQFTPGSGTAAGGARDWLLAASTRSSSLLSLSAAPAPADASVVGLSVDLGTARVTELGPGQGLGSPRRFASLSELGARFIVAGGLDPETLRARGDAEIFDPVRGSFEATRVALASPRARHAALSLPSGATLLIGGESELGLPLGSVEVISPDTTRPGRSLELLAEPRVAPTALLLGDGRILVGGGYRWAEAASPEPATRAKTPSSSLEFLSFDLADVAAAPIRLEPAALDRGFVELAAGSALAVGGCTPGVREGDCLPCGESSGCISREVWWIDPQGQEHPLEPLPTSLAAAAPRLVAAAEGAPWLIANGRLARFDPWEARFRAVDEVAQAPLDPLLPTPVAVGPGLFVWLQDSDEATQLFGFYSSQRGPLSQDVAPLLVGSGRAVVPHRPPTTQTDPAVTLRYGVATGLELAGSAAVVSIADTDYASFTLDLTLAAGPAPLLRLGGRGASAGESTSFGGLECAWPDFAPPTPEDPTSWVRLRVQRSADGVSLLLAGAPGAATPTPTEACRRSLPDRVSIELLGTPLGTTRLTRIEIRRSLD